MPLSVIRERGRFGRWWWGEGRNREIRKELEYSE
jgi:hypothetical protein